MCFFDCKCKSLKILGENIQQTEQNIQKQEQLEENMNKNINTGYPAHEPTANKYLSGSDCEIYVFFLYMIFLYSFLNCFSLSCSVLFMFLCVFR